MPARIYALNGRRVNIPGGCTAPVGRFRPPCWINLSWPGVGQITRFEGFTSLEEEDTAQQ